MKRKILDLLYTELHDAISSRDALSMQKNFVWCKNCGQSADHLQHQATLNATVARINLANELIDAYVGAHTA